MFRHTQVAVNSASASRTGLSPSAAGRSGPFRSLPLRMTPLLLPRHMPCDTAGLGSSPFDRLYLGNRCYFLFLRVLRCFSSPGSPRAFRAVSGSLPTGCPIRTSGGLSVFATRPGFSQLVTSFFASESHRHPPCALLCFPFFFSPSSDRLPRLFRPGCSILQFDCSLFSRISSSLGFGFNASASFQICLSIMSMTSPLVFLVVPGRVELPTSTLSV